MKLPVRIITFLSAVSAIACPAFADSAPASVQWNGWSVASTEYLWRAPVKKYVNHAQVRYPLTNLFDGDPKTAWVFCDADKPWRKWNKETAVWKGDSQTVPSIHLSADRPVAFDGIWLMNGYNRDKETFARNNRVTEITIIVDGDVVKTTRLGDWMGWHKVTLPKWRAARIIEIAFTGIKRGPDDDLCLSEISLRHMGKPVNMRLPQAVLFSPGTECCGSDNFLMNRRGALLAAGADGEGMEMAWSPSGRYIAGCFTVYGEQNGRKEQPHIWVGDTKTGRVVVREYLSDKERMMEEMTLNWQGDSRVEVRATGPNKWRRVLNVRPKVSARR